MLKLIIGNKVYSSWSMRGWLAAKQSGLPFEEILYPLYDADWPARRAGAELVPSNGKVPILYDGDIAVWDSLAIVEHLAEQAGADRFWPADPAARALARSMAAEMHSGYLPLRRDCTMNTRRRYAPAPLSPEVEADMARICALWREARTRFGAGGPYLFGDYGAADIMFAPVATRCATYAIPLPADAQAYVDTVLAHPHVRQWLDEAEAEPWVLERFERPDQ
jgi:glutathione S-transferase